MSPRACEACRHDNSDFASRCEQCGAELGLSLTAEVSQVAAPEKDPWLGRVFQHYRVDALLGKGGMGVVYRGSDLKLRRPVALKFLAPTLSHDSTARARFMREARAASALDHPNIGTLYDIDEVEGTAFLSMALYEGETLRTRLERGPLAEPEALRIAGALTSALQAAHAAGIAHRDLKPGNVMLTRDGQVKLLDFGLAKLLDADDDLQTTGGAALGTPGYMAPEQLRAEPAGPAADWWALGVVLYEMLTAKSPFGSGTAAVVCSRILSESPTPLPGTVSPQVSGLVTRLLVKDSRTRLADPARVMTALTQPGARRHRWWIAPIALAILAAIAWWAFPRHVSAGLSATSNAASTSWFLDGKSIASGVAAVTIHELSPGAHTLRLEAEGFQPRESTLTLTAGQTLDLRWSLTPIVKPIEEPIVKPIEEPIAKSVEKPIEKPSEKPKAKKRPHEPQVTWPPPE